MTANDGPLLEELKRITRILTLANAVSIERELSKVATSQERRRIWVLVDGAHTSAKIAEEVGVTTRSVNRFLVLAESAGLVEKPWGKPPLRVIDYVPPSWTESAEEAGKKAGESVRRTEID